MAFYDQKPSTLEAVGNGSYMYRFDIEEKQAPANNNEGSEEPEANRTQWQCEEVVVWSPLTANKILEAVIAHCVPATREQKLVNDYNAAQLGMVGGSKTSDEAKEKIAAYKEFLSLRATLKNEVDSVCAQLHID